MCTLIIRKPEGGARVGLSWLKMREAAAGAFKGHILGVPGVCTASRRGGPNLVGAQTTPPLCATHLGAHLRFAQAGCTVIDPAGRASPGGSARFAAAEPGLRRDLSGQFF